MDFVPETYLQGLDLWVLIGYGVLQIIETVIFVVVTIGIKKKIAWGKLNLERFGGGYGLAILITTVIALLNTEFLKVYLWIVGILAGYGIHLMIFNHVNENTKRTWFFKSNIPNSKCWLKSYTTYRNQHDERVAIALNDEMREPFRSLLKRIFGKTKIVEIRNSGTPFVCNETDELFCYTKFAIRKSNGNYAYWIEPNTNIGDLAFLKAYDRHYATKNELDNKSQEIIRLRMEMHYLARLEARLYLDPIIKHIYGKYYDEWKRLRDYMDAEDNEELRKLYRKEQKAAAEEAEETAKKFEVVDEESEFVSDEYEYLS